MTKTRVASAALPSLMAALRGVCLQNRSIAPAGRPHAPSEKRIRSFNDAMKERIRFSDGACGRPAGAMLRFCRQTPRRAAMRLGRAALATLVLVILNAPLTVDAQQAAKVYRIGL